MDKLPDNTFFWLKLPFNKVYYIDDVGKMAFSILVMLMWMVLLVLHAYGRLPTVLLGLGFVLLCIWILVYAYARWKEERR